MKKHIEVTSEKLSREFINRLPSECRIPEQYKNGYRQFSPECPLNYAGAPDPLNLMVGRAYDLTGAGAYPDTKSRVFVEYQLRAEHERILDGRDENGYTKYKQDVWAHRYHGIWLFRTLPGEKKTGFYVTDLDRRIRGESQQQPDGHREVVKQPKSLTSQQNPDLARKRHNAAVKAWERLLHFRHLPGSWLPA